ncbi:restriction endonuclease [Streptomyces lavendulae]|uniref:restriction endonuclease n=1 Tax=Streptomyces lavendulae TaxID=1914 RepID=UPI0025538057|nr:restriction endonuclease [Streptomyces lavendulae]
MAREGYHLVRERGRAGGSGKRIAVGGLALVALMAVAGIAAAQGRPVALATALALVAVAGWRTLNRAARPAALRITLAEFDAMGHEEFAYAVRDLLVRDGWGARRAAGVIGADTRHGRILVRARHTRAGAAGATVGTSVMAEARGAAGPAHRADHAVVVTNGGFTQDAKAWGDRHGVRWIDRELLRRWAEQGAPLADLLRLPPDPLRPPQWRALRTRQAP